MKLLQQSKIEQDVTDEVTIKQLLHALSLKVESQFVPYTWWYNVPTCDNELTQQMSIEYLLCARQCEARGNLKTHILPCKFFF